MLKLLVYLLILCPADPLPDWVGSMVDAAPTEFGEAIVQVGYETGLIDYTKEFTCIERSWWEQMEVRQGKREQAEPEHRMGIVYLMRLRARRLPDPK